MDVRAKSSTGVGAAQLRLERASGGQEAEHRAPAWGGGTGQLRSGHQASGVRAAASRRSVLLCDCSSMQRTLVVLVLTEKAK